MGHDTDRDQRSGQVRSALLKALVLVGVIAVLIALGTVLVVRALGLDGNGSAGPETSGAAAPSGPAGELPTTALPVPGQDSASAVPSESVAPRKKARRSGLRLDVSPVRPRTGERVNLTGRYRGADNVVLEVQRFEDGEWRDFGVRATVRVGSYGIYVVTGRSGEQRFRMWDPIARRSSNVVRVTIS